MLKGLTRLASALPMSVIATPARCAACPAHAVDRTLGAFKSMPDA
jgi:hypothetical protein